MEDPREKPEARRDDHAPFRLRYHEIHRDQWDAHTDDEWFTARREQAVNDIRLLMARYRIRVEDLA